MDLSHYKIARIPKANGKLRVLHIPSPELMEKQRELLFNEYRTGVGPGPYATGFVRNRSILDHAKPHIGKKFVVEVDIKDFFHSVRPWHLDRAWKREKLKPAEILIRKMVVRDRNWQRMMLPIGLLDIAFVWAGKKCFLPQGSPLSPYLANLAMKEADFRIGKLLKAIFKTEDRASFTRYADNIALSADSERIVVAAKHIVEKILLSLRFHVNHSKFRVMRRSARQKVCGIVVNDKATVPKKKRHEIRGRVENLWKDAKAGKEVGLEEFKYVEGYLAYMTGIDPPWANRFKVKMAFVRDYQLSKQLKEEA
jgi:RNA-directed DNA polymerase